MEHENIVEFMVYGDYALFSDLVTRVGGEKFSYQIPTYEAIKGILSSVYWKPTIIWQILSVRVMNPIQTETKGIRPIKYAKSGNDLSYYTYLKNCCYQVKAKFIWNLNRPELENDRNENKHHQIAKRMIERGGRRDIFLGARECQGYVEPCVFGGGKGAYDDISEISFGNMYHSMTYPDEAYSVETKGHLTVNLWNAVMKNGYINFPPQEKCIHRTVKEMKMKIFDKSLDNFSGFEEFKGVE